MYFQVEMKRFENPVHEVTVILPLHSRANVPTLLRPLFQVEIPRSQQKQRRHRCEKRLWM